MQPVRKDVECLLDHLSTQLGCSMSRRQPEHFIAMVEQGVSPEIFADVVIGVEGSR